jgi:hypothetical protein
MHKKLLLIVGLTEHKHGATTVRILCVVLSFDFGCMLRLIHSTIDISDICNVPLSLRLSYDC